MKNIYFLYFLDEEHQLFIFYPLFCNGKKYRLFPNIEKVTYPTNFGFKLGLLKSLKKKEDTEYAF